MIYSKIEYGQPTWIKRKKTHIKKLQVLQNDALRTASRVTRLMHVRITDLHKECNVKLIEERTKSATLRYLKSKEDSPLLQELLGKLNRKLNRIGWHKKMREGLTD